MGIKYFFSWFKTKYPYCLETVNTDVKKEIDNLAMDLNGIFHTSAQAIYKYGNSPKFSTKLLRPVPENVNPLKKQRLVFEDIAKKIDTIFNIVNPRKKLILCIDGVAGASKMSQQRQRRFKNSIDHPLDFDGNCITPGTKFMDYLSRYLDWFIKFKMSTSEKWKNIEVVFSTEKTPGEGEHKIMNYIRKFGSKDESFCVHGADADLFMLTLALHHPKIYILRENIKANDELYLIDIYKFSKELSKEMIFESTKHYYDPIIGINDFVFMCFLAGNDFLPHIPNLEIVEGGIDLLIDVYKKTCSEYGQLTQYKKSNIPNFPEVIFNKKSVKVLLGSFTQYEKNILEDRLNKKDFRFPYPILEKNTIQTETGYKVNIDAYKRDYYIAKFPDFTQEKLKEVCHNYLEGMQWILCYYTKGIPSWTWCYKHNFAPFSEDIVLFIDSFKFKSYPSSEPVTPFEQLLSVLPPSSYNLLPEPFNKFLVEPESPIIDYYPKEFKIDLDGKKWEWEGIPILPMVDLQKIRNLYLRESSKINEKDIKRNIPIKSYIYKYIKDFEYTFKSFYGDINCKVKTYPINL